MLAVNLAAERAASIRRAAARSAGNSGETVPLLEVARRAGLTESGIKYLVRRGHLAVVRRRGSGNAHRYEVPATEATRFILERLELKARGLKRPRRLESRV